MVAIPTAANSKNFTDCKHIRTPVMIFFLYSHFCFELILIVETVFAAGQTKQEKQRYASRNTDD